MIDLRRFGKEHQAVESQVGSTLILFHKELPIAAFDVASGKGYRITTASKGESVATSIWLNNKEGLTHTEYVDQETLYTLY